MKKRFWILLGIIILAAGLRLWQLGSVPSSPDWDEAALGYNAYSLIHTGKDEYGKFMPIILRSFDDYKPALYAYLTIPSVIVFDVTTFAVRLPSAVFGILTVLAVYFLVDDCVRRKKEQEKFDKYIAFFAAFFLAISPWHIQFSRIAFESNVGLAMNVFGTLFFLKGLRRPWLLILSVISFAAALYVYQSEKVFTPLLALGLLIIFHKELFKVSRKYLYVSLIIGLVLVMPMLSATLTDKEALARARGVSVFSDTTQLLQKNVERLAASKEQNDLLGTLLNNRRIIFVQTVVANYFSHFNPNWLFIGGDIARHHAPNMGMLYLFELPLILVGIYQLLFGKWDKKVKFLFFLWFLLAAVPASITSGVPHAVRTLNFLPIYQVFVAFGLATTLQWSLHQYQTKRKQNVKLLVSIAIGLLAICYSLFALINFGYYLGQYFVRQNIENSKEWQYGYKEAIEEIKKVENRYTKIVVSNQPHLDQSYMFFLFYLKYPPDSYQKEAAKVSGGFRENHAFGKYEFRPIKWQEESEDGVLYVGRPEDFDSGYNQIASVDFLDGKKAIIIAEK